MGRSEGGAIALHSWGGLILDPGPLASTRPVLYFLKASHQWDIWGGRAVQCRHSDHKKVPSRLIRQSPGGATQAHTGTHTSDAAAGIPGELGWFPPSSTRNSVLQHPRWSERTDMQTAETGQRNTEGLRASGGENPTSCQMGKETR